MPTTMKSNQFQPTPEELEPVDHQFQQDLHRENIGDPAIHDLQRQDHTAGQRMPIGQDAQDHRIEDDEAGDEAAEPGPLDRAFQGKIRRLLVECRSLHAGPLILRPHGATDRFVPSKRWPAKPEA
jgi:hypothetical protein